MPAAFPRPEHSSGSRLGTYNGVSRQRQAPISVLSSDRWIPPQQPRQMLLILRSSAFSSGVA